jgi:hypothetical protein
MRIPCVVATLVLLGVPLAYGKVCSERDANAADAVIDHLDSWAEVNTAYMKYGHCDAGEIAEGNSEAIARLLVDRWRDLPELDGLIKRNPPLKAFVLRHIDTTLDSRDLDRIKQLSTASCPAGMGTLCGELASAASRSQR